MSFEDPHECDMRRAPPLTPPVEPPPNTSTSNVICVACECGGQTKITIVELHRIIRAMPAYIKETRFELYPEHVE